MLGAYQAYDYKREIIVSIHEIDQRENIHRSFNEHTCTMWLRVNGYIWSCIL